MIFQKRRTSISIKLILITVVLLLATVIPIAMQSYNFYAGDSIRREELSKENQAKAKANEVERLFQNIQDKARITATLLLKRSTKQSIEKSENETLDLTFGRDDDLLSVEVIKRSAEGKHETLDEIVSEKKLKLAKRDKSYFQDLERILPHSLNPAFYGHTVIENVSLDGGLPLLTMAFPLAKNQSGVIDTVARAYFRLDRIQNLFSEQSESQIFLLDSQGTVLAHPDESMTIARKSLINSPIVKMALETQQKRFQTKYTQPESGLAFIAAFAKTDLGPIVISEVPETIILEPARIVRRQSIFTAGMILSTALFLIFAFSITLTAPIEALVEITKEISKGNFDVVAKRKVRSNDEVGELASAFDQMTTGLKERDKVKSLFSKFHGSSVADDLMAQDSLDVGGENKEVTVFFSDIRGFTKFSESRAPEEVVEMLNEYFEIMVGIITKHNGIVDKFIGDAIMAVWGAPRSSGHDQQSAMQACLEMRIALNTLNEKRMARGQDPIMIGMGLHSGRAISGTIGSQERMEYTVIGDTVNVTARIEASTKAFGTDLLVSEITAETAKDLFIIEKAGAAEVKGKSEPLKLFKVKGYYRKDEESGELTPVLVQTPYSDYEAEHADKVKVA